MCSALIIVAAAIVFVPDHSRAALTCTMTVSIDAIYQIDDIDPFPLGQAEWYYHIAVDDSLGRSILTSDIPIVSGQDDIDPVPGGASAWSVTLNNPTNYVTITISLWEDDGLASDFTPDDVADISPYAGGGADDYGDNFPDAPSGAALVLHYYVLRSGSQTDHMFANEPWINWYQGSSTSSYSFSGLGYNKAEVIIRVYDNYNDVTAPPAPSPDDLVTGWTTDSSRTFGWSTPSDTSGVYGYSWSVDGSPDDVVDTTSDLVSVSSQPEGTHTFYVRAMDNAGVWGTAGSHEFSIDLNPPTCTITSPSGGEVVSGSIAVTADAGDEASGITEVLFYLDSVFQYSDATAPYEWQWDTTTASNEQHTLTATAYDGAGRTTPAVARLVTVDNTVIPEFSSATLVSVVLLLMIAVSMVSRRLKPSGRN